MEGNIIYFSGTGNTEYIARLFKSYLKDEGISAKLIDISKKRFISDEYDFLILGAPVYAEFYPRYFINWVKDKIPTGRKREVIIFTTMAAKSSSALYELIQIMEEKDYVIKIATEIQMPNNFYLSNIFGRPSLEEIAYRKEAAKYRVKSLINIYTSNKTLIDRAALTRRVLAKPVHSIFTEYSNTWAKKNLKVDMDYCVRCSKCVKNCPTKNVSLDEEIVFKEQCIYCLKCLNQCPVNAFLYKNSKVEQYIL